MKPTVHDIAAHAGVSLATVDRVLNRRPGVREATRAKVEAVIERLGYVRDVAAANLAKGRVYPLIFILPDNDNSFMRELRAQVEDAISRSASERTAIELVAIRAFDTAALVEALEAAREKHPAGVAFVAIEAPEVVVAATRLRQAGIPVVTLVSDLSEARDHYAGIDNIAAGRTAASLLGRFVGVRAGPVAVLAGSMLVRDHRERLEGFKQVMEADFPLLPVMPVLEGRDEPERAEKLVAETLAAHPYVRGIYSAGAGNRGLMRALKAHAADLHIAVIAHELTATTRAGLLDGTIDAVLNQDAGHEVRSAIRVLKAKADGLPVITGQERIRLDIFVRDNLP